MTRLLENVYGTKRAEGVFIRIDPEALEGLFSDFRSPMLGQCDEKTQALLFPGFTRKLRSVAISPLVLQNHLIGCLNQGSSEANHFSSESATDMLEHLSAVLAVCIDNVIAHEKLREDGLTDSLTCLANRRFFEKRLTEEVDRWVRHGKDLSCLLVDVDLFKQVNDQCGHQTGDEVLKKLARVFGNDLRASDVLARYGGEEFVLLLPETPRNQAHEIAERLRLRVEEMDLCRIRKEGVPVTVSVGVSTLESAEKRMTPVEACGWLLSQADSALYRAKEEGRNRVLIAGC